MILLFLFDRQGFAMEASNSGWVRSGQLAGTL